MKSFLSDYKGKKILLSSQEAGEISGVLFNTTFEKVEGFIYKKNLLRYDFFLTQEIQKESQGTIAIKKYQDTIESYYDIIGKTVRNKENAFVGIVENIEFDITFKLKNLIVDIGYNMSSIEMITPTKIAIKKNYIQVAKKHILSYQEDAIIIDDTLLIKENKKTLENISKIFINIPNPSYNINP